MPIKISELVIQVKVYGTNKKVDQHQDTPVGYSLNIEQQKLIAAKELLSLLEDQKSR